MSPTLDALRGRHDRIAIPTVWLAFALSLMLHVLLLAGWLPKVRLLPFEDAEHRQPGHSLAVRLIPLPGAAPAPPPSLAIQAQPAPAHRPRPLMASRQHAAAPQAAPRVLAIERPSDSGATPRPAENAQPPARDDFASLVDARRRARESAAAAPPSPANPPAPRAESERERQERIVAANLGLDRVPTFGADRRQGGGIFQIQRMGYASAEYVFFGWNRFIKRNSNQVIEVQRGSNPSMEIAVVRSMIAIIREHEQGNFVWESIRLGREVSLSARMSDTAGLEDFLMQEFFSGTRPRN